MTIEIKAPTFPESVADGTIATWYKQPGEAVARDEIIVDIETDKVVLEVLAPADGSMSEILKGEGETVLSDELIGRFVAGEAVALEAAPAAAAPAVAETNNSGDKISPAARKLIKENSLNVDDIKATGKGGLVTKEDVVKHLSSAPAPAAAKPVTADPAPIIELDPSQRPEKRVPMTRLRKRIAERLLDASQSTAMLTTFNEVDMGPIMELRKQYKDLFEKSHNGVRLGFMGFFVKAATEALKRFPAVNASLDGDDIVYHGYQDIGVAVSTEKGLVVPVLRDTDQMSIAKVEDTIRDFGLRAKAGKLGIDEMQGGTFTITNGGVFGSLLSTPILNPPQTAILGMHKIQERVMAVNGEVKIRPMMYLAISYDHRLIDGKDAVQFLVAIKEQLEEPARILLEL
ncbi:2-oxoglutarate dehydrogenase complex dihydrolipoyllysine-residue succinyltransferase [Dasania sp. GY-MA-18]|uniref:Dihydrolipoyllysine-residue succinyltransferase component of 2-oxoglutarate dehydrogenase complex n=1 Tax=Dasania phycosphaerae TaxID=2950436 RepID=A0A9J6RMX3_9GAMM|nr:MULTISPECIES: 2-oxoglutarate dehydrogenase complex dihydrolipoyllysine-residue succinyltransferase [Dasania]MCR8922910.1 2-oxoglutarate dehydrogenase complex dihydrolipoyllysine-residue succinyltransferase [Dasania sp. GY-MA-18]MCZ0865341.1 2-oxoglutarate dehydrogenase complex dihydrolipoyllysine-residue succinyltransferase [Dasania phycosphaerae]MCZ0869066.1 2-oxoglutarate dehydrogenase complex dihydrolipoyllysine-residue succinyltransferase [Dasania phycosphaerae]